METISLRDYNLLNNSLVDQGSYHEAIFHSTSILRNYPKCADTYRALGTALFENQDNDNAAYVFTKVLQAYPNDQLSHSKMSELLEANNDIDGAIWHLKRAFEVQPSNHVIQENLKRLLTKRDGIQPSKIRLTRGALVRMFAKGELYQQAITEALALLETDSERVEIKLLLARMYLSSGAIINSSEVCEEILKSHLYCYEANQILEEIRPKYEDEDETSVFKQRMIEIDPYTRFIDSGRPSSGAVNSDEILLEKGDFRANALGENEIPEWKELITSAWKDVYPNVETRFISNEKIAALDDELESHTYEEPALSNEDLPDWITTAGWTRASIKAPPTGQSPQEAPNPDNGLSNEENLPAWLKSLVSGNVVIDDDSPSNAEGETSPDSPSESILGDTQPVGVSQTTNSENSLDFKIPGWLKSLDKELDQPLGSDKNKTVSNTGVDELEQLATHQEKLLDITSSSIEEPLEKEQLAVEPEPLLTDEAFGDETTQAIIIEHPDGDNNGGAISDEVNADLLSWLENINPEEAREPYMQPEVSSPITRPEEDVHDTKESVEVSVAGLSGLLEDGKYADLRNLVGKKDIPAEVLREVESKAVAHTENEPSPFELWKAIGDINITLGDLEKALQAYQKAEKYLFHR